ncbi:MAG: glycogen-binding domain-containing protein [Elusimicrobia bacterium]|nr:glycogen-binding domain-containing protein [Elusimicrobiota bacterium]
MNWRNRWTFWGLVIVVLALVSVPSVDWLTALRSYARFASGWEPAPLRPTHPSFTPREGPVSDEPLPKLEPSEFRLRAPRAKSVELVGDFNAWKPGLLKMTRSGANWSLVVPLLPGRHEYLFLVDGTPRVDPRAPTADGPMGRRVSVRTVQ